MSRVAASWWAVLAHDARGSARGLEGIHPALAPRTGAAVWAPLVGLALACGDASRAGDAGRAGDASRVDDAGISEDAWALREDVAPSAGDSSTPRADAEAPRDGAVIGDHVRVRLHDGRIIEGEWVWRYDHRRWRHGADDEATLALFTYARALVMVPESMVSSGPSPLTPAGPSFLESQRALGHLVDGLPLFGTWQVYQGAGGYHLEEDGYGDFAWDFVRVGADGRSYGGSGLRNEDYYAFGEDVSLTATATVVFVARDADDNAPGSFVDGELGNVVGVDVGGGYGLYFFHLMRGSVPAEVTVGAALPAGARVGRVGNSGWSLAPHLHLVMYAYDEGAQRFFSVPAEVRSLRVGTSAQTLEARRFVVPRTGEFVAR
jgi:hypothetical protein